MDGQKTFFLDLQTLLTYLSGQSCELTTSLTLSGKQAHGSLLLKDGRIVDCLVSVQGGPLLRGEQAYKLLQHGAQWQVRLGDSTEKTAAFSPNSAPSAPPGMRYLPRQKRPLDPALLQHIPARERLVMRSVFMLINGSRTVEEIKAYLHLPAESVNEALSRLRRLDLIE